MKSLLTLFVALFFSANAYAYAPQVGKEAPDFTLQGSDGEEYKLSDYKGKIIVLEWFNHLCPFVRKQYDAGIMQNLQKTYTDLGVVWLSVISSAPGKQGHVSPEQARENTAADKAFPTSVLLDPEGTVGKLYDAKTTPHMFIIDTEGKIAYMGAIDSVASTNQADTASATNYVEQGLDELLAGGYISETITHPYGCPVKY